MNTINFRSLIIVIVGPALKATYMHNIITTTDGKTIGSQSINKAIDAVLNNVSNFNIYDCDNIPNIKLSNATKKKIQ